MDWIGWFGHLVWQPARDERVEQVRVEVDEIRPVISQLKEQTAELVSASIGERGRE